MKQAKNNLLGLKTGVLLFILTLVRMSLAAPDEAYKKLDVFAQVLQYIQNSYVDEVDSRKILYGAIRNAENP